MPPDPLEVCTFGAPLGSWSVFILDPRLMIIHYTSKQRKMKFKPRIKLNYNIYTVFYKQTLQRTLHYPGAILCVNIATFLVSESKISGKNVRKFFFISRALKKCFFEAQKLAVESRGIFDLPWDGKGIRNWFEARRKNGRIVLLRTIELVLVLDGSL